MAVNAQPGATIRTAKTVKAAEEGSMEESVLLAGDRVIGATASLPNRASQLRLVAGVDVKASRHKRFTRETPGVPVCN